MIYTLEFIGSGPQGMLSQGIALELYLRAQGTLQSDMLSLKM
jgi:hypothetical protein